MRISIISKLATLSIAWIAAGCADPPPPPGLLAPAPAVTQPGPVPAPAPVAARPTIERPTLDASDLRESATSRDPFRCLLRRDPPLAPGPPCQGKLVSYGLDELQLTGIVGGGARSRAMFRPSSSSVSTTVRRGDRIGKTCSRIKAILRDRVIVTIRVRGSDKEAERVIALHDGRG